MRGPGSSVPLVARPAKFTHSWDALRAAVAGLQDQAFAQPSGCTGRLVRDLVCHLIIDAQDVLGAPPTGEDPLDALIVRLAAAHREPGLLTFISTISARRRGVRRRSPTRTSRWCLK